MPRRTKPLSDPRVRSLRPGTQRADYRDGHSPGLILTVLPSGRKQWSVRYVVAGKHKRHVLGDYPDLTLSKAREDAADLRPALRRGDDPAAAKRARTERPTDTVEALAREYLEKHALPRKDTGKEDQRVLDRDVLPKIGARRVRDLTRREVRDVIEAIAARGAPIMANRTLEVVRKMLNFGIKRDWLDANPAAGIEKPGIEVSRDRVLTDDEIRKLWRLLSHFPTTPEKQAPGRKRATSPKDDPFCPVSPTLAAVQKVRLITAQRGGEVVRMRWKDLDLDAGWWTIPREHSKNGQPHRVPLTDDAIAIIEAQQPDPDEREGDVFTSRQGARVVARLPKAGAACARALGFEFRSHDLRRTAATRMAAAGIPRESISAVLNHVQGGPVATRTYDRYDRDAEKRVALETWSRELARILAAKPGTNVVPMRRKGA